MRRKAKRTRLRPRPFILLGLAANLVAGALYSPLSTVRRVRVEGAPLEDEGRLRDLMQKLKGVPCAQVNARALEAEALQNSEIKSASLARTPFGTAVLKIVRRTAVAHLDRYRGTGLTEDGVLYRSTVPLDDLPTVALPEDHRFVGLTLGNGWRPVDVARLATSIRSIPSDRPIKIDLDKGGRVCLNIGTGAFVGIVDFGPYEGLDAKAARLESILRERPNLFESVQTLKLVNIDNPAYVPRPGAPQR